MKPLPSKTDFNRKGAKNAKRRSKAETKFSQLRIALSGALHTNDGHFLEFLSRFPRRGHCERGAAGPKVSDPGEAISI